MYEKKIVQETSFFFKGRRSEKERKLHTEELHICALS
jgi:hypothetical protein